MTDESRPASVSAERDRDLGFGRVVADASHKRLLNRDGSFNVRRQGLGWRHIVSLYYSLLNLTWPRFVLLIILANLGLNAIFALGFLAAGPGALEGALSDRPFRTANLRRSRIDEIERL